MIAVKVICTFCFEKIIVSFESIIFFRSEEIQGASQNFYPTKKGWVTIFSLEPNMEGLIYINYSWSGPCLFSKLTKGQHVGQENKSICLWRFLPPSLLNQPANSRKSHRLNTHVVLLSRQCMYIYIVQATTCTKL